MDMGESVAVALTNDDTECPFCKGSPEPEFEKIEIVNDSSKLAENAGGKPKDIDKAQHELVKAQRELDKSKPKPDKAIDHYGHAWDKALKAVRPHKPHKPHK